MLFVRFLFLVFLGTNLFAGTIDLNKIAKEATDHNKTVMVFFHTEVCPYCEKMLRESFEQSSDMDIINKDYYFVDINLDAFDIVIYKKFKGTTAKFADLFKVRFYPTILFMEHNTVVSDIKGYRNKEKFRLILKYISSKSYQSMDLETFINEQEMKD
ncbi:MAG: thioredoxin fold domain-containing protein [Epsilonproteobacteria bacterium]|nr:thioredoxin fold domain-containing protein [Campylobacterota bacterium]